MEPVRLGIVGCGVMGNNHLGAAQRVPEVKVVAVADLRLDRAQEAAKKYSVPKVFCEGAELLDDPDVDAVVLALPNFGRPYLALRAFANGKHVLLEKPMALDLSECDKMINAANRAGVQLMVGHVLRFNQRYAAAYAEIAGGKIGIVRHFYGRRNNPRRAARRCRASPAGSG